MSFNVNTELNNLFSTLGKLNVASFGSSSNGSLTTSDYINSVFTAGGSVAALAQAETSEQKAQIVDQLVKQALSIFTKLVANEAQKAKSEVKKQDTKTSKLVEESREVGVKLEGDFKEVADSVEAQNKIVADATKLIEKTQKSIEKKQEEIAKIVDKIEEERSKLEGKTPEQKAEILATIQGLAGEIASIGATIEVDNEQLQSLTEVVSDATSNIETATEKMTVIEEDGAAQIAQLSQDATQSGVEVAQTATEGVINETTGAALQTAASTASSNLITGTTIAPKLYQSANDQNKAGLTRLSSVQTNINRIAQGIGGLTNATQIAAQFKTSIGSALGDFAGAIGSWETAVAPVITGLGSFADVAVAAEELNEAAEADLETLGFDVNEKGKVEKVENQNEAPEANTEANNGEDLATQTFDIERLRTFGI